MSSEKADFSLMFILSQRKYDRNDYSYYGYAQFSYLVL